MSDKEATPLLGDNRVKKIRSDYGTRWVVLVLSCLLMIGNYYCYDNPSALASQLKNYFSDTSFGGDGWQEWFALMYSVYSFPNIVLPFFGGFLVDYFGVRVMLIVFNLFILSGQLLFAFGISLKSVPVVLAGRTVFGFGGESLTVAQSALVAVWFQNREVAFALGLNLSIARLGGVINNLLSPIFWNMGGHLSMWVGAIICGGSLACTLMLVPIDKKIEKRLEEENGESADVKVDEKIKLTDVKNFALPFWLLTISCVVVYGTVLPFNNVASAFLQQRDFMPHTNVSWYNNRTYVLPRDCTTLEANVTTCTLDLSASSMHAVFHDKGNATLPYANVTSKCANSPLLTATCAPGYEPSKGQPVIGQCCGASGHKGNVSYASSSGKCVRKTNATTCDATSWELNAIFPAGTYKEDQRATATNCTYGYTFSRANSPSWANSGPPVQATCKKGVWDHDPTSGICVPVLYEADKYCAALDTAEQEANQVMSIPYIISAVISPFLGAFIDKVGKRAILATLAPAVLIAVHMLLAYTTLTPYVPLVGQGLAYSIFAAALWPSIPYVVEPQYVGTAYGLLTAIQNGGLALFPIIVGKILSSCDNAQPTADGKFVNNTTYDQCITDNFDYRWTEVFFVGLAGLGLLIGFYLNYDDSTKRSNRLNQNKKQREAAEKATPDIN